MKSKIKFLIVVLFLVIAASATETTWRHSGFEVTSFDINLSSTFNITELRVLEWGWNSSTPSISDSNRAKMYYDNNQKRILQSIDGGAYEATVTNATVNLMEFNLSKFTEVDTSNVITVNSTSINVSSASNQVAKVYKNIMPRGDFVLDFDLQSTTPSSGSFVAYFILSNSSGIHNGGNFYGIGASLSAGVGLVRVQTAKINAGVDTLGSNIVIGTNKVYVRVEKEGTNLTVSAFSDAVRTTHISISPQIAVVSDINDYNVLHVTHINTEGNGIVSYYASNFTLYSQ